MKTHYFLDQKFIIYEGTYVPHFESEFIILLAERIIKRTNMLITEIGSGSGCIPITLKKRNKDIYIVTIEKCKNVYDNAVHNCVIHNSKIICINADLYNIEQIHSNIIISNPPYITSEETAKISNGNPDIIRNIDGGKDGLDFIRQIFKVSDSVEHIILELGYEFQKNIIETEFINKWRIEKFEKPISNQEVFFCHLKNKKFDI